MQLSKPRISQIPEGGGSLTGQVFACSQATRALGAALGFVPDAAGATFFDAVVGALDGSPARRENEVRVEAHRPV